MYIYIYIYILYYIAAVEARLGKLCQVVARSDPDKHVLSTVTKNEARTLRTLCRKLRDAQMAPWAQPETNIEWLQRNVTSLGVWAGVLTLAAVAVYNVWLQLLRGDGGSGRLLGSKGLLANWTVEDELMRRRHLMLTLRLRKFSAKVAATTGGQSDRPPPVLVEVAALNVMSGGQTDGVSGSVGADILRHTLGLLRYRAVAISAAPRLEALRALAALDVTDCFEGLIAKETLAIKDDETKTVDAKEEGENEQSAIRVPDSVQQAEKSSTERPLSHRAMASALATLGLCSKRTELLTSSLDLTNCVDGGGGGSVGLMAATQGTYDAGLALGLKTLRVGTPKDIARAGTFFDASSTTAKKKTA